MSKLGFNSKADFQIAFFAELVKKYFDGGNRREGCSIAADIENIVVGLSNAWDIAEECKEEQR